MPLPQKTLHTAVISVLLAVVITGGLFGWEQRQKNISEELSLTAAHGTSFKPFGCDPACTAATITAAPNPQACGKWCKHNCEAFPQYCDDGNPCTNDSCSDTNEFVCAPSTPKCSGALPACLPDGTCVQCVGNNNCSVNQFCDLSKNKCVASVDVGVTVPTLTPMTDGDTQLVSIQVKNNSITQASSNVNLSVTSNVLNVSLPNAISGCSTGTAKPTQVICNFPSLAANEQKTILVHLQDDASSPCDPQNATVDTMVVTAWDPDAKNNSNSQSITITCPKTDLAVGATTPITVKPGLPGAPIASVENKTSVKANTITFTAKATKLKVSAVPTNPMKGTISCTNPAAAGGSVTCTFPSMPLPAPANNSGPASIPLRLELASATTCTAGTDTLELNVTAANPADQNSSNNSAAYAVEITCCGNGTVEAGEECDGTKYSCDSATCKCKAKFDPEAGGVCVFECPAGDQAAIDQFCNDTCAPFGADKTACVTDCKSVCKPTSSSSSSYSGGSSSQGGAEGGAQGGDIGGQGGGDQGGTGGEQGGPGGVDGGAEGGGDGGKCIIGVTCPGGSSVSQSMPGFSSHPSSRSSSISSVSTSSRSSSSGGSGGSSQSSASSSRSSGGSGGSSQSGGSQSSGSGGSGGSSSSISIDNVCELGCLAGGTEFCAAQGKTCVPTLAFPCLVCVGSSSSSRISSASTSRSSSVKSVSSSSSARSFSSFAFFSSARFCGNNILEPGEECEASHIPSDSDISCISCRIVFNVSCGDGRLDPGEDCDDGNENDSDGCSSVCDIEFISFNPASSSSTPPFIQELPSSQPRLILPPHICGDGAQELGETCDDGNTVSGDGCSASCKLEEQLIPGRCGDSQITLGEECDDGNARDFDGCSAQCKLEVGRCGDGILQTLLGEQCEPKLHDGSTGVKCGVDCRLISPTCGDAKIDPGEECDDGAANLSDTLADRCRTNCSAARCGDRVLDSVEQCDDGNRLGGDGCDRFCRTEAGAPPSQVAANIIELPSLPFPPFTQQPPIASLTPIVQTHAPVGDTGPAALAVMAAGAAAGYSWMRRKMRKK